MKSLKIALGFLTVSSFLIFSGCETEKTESKSMQQIYKEQGVPVKVENVKKGQFNLQLTYNSILTGYEESNIYASFGDRVEKVLVKVGDYVKKDQLLITFPDDNPAANYYQAKVAYENSKKNLERYENLYKTGGISLQNLDNVRTQFKVSEANWKAVSKGIKVLAPISGTVAIISVRESDNVKKKQHLITITNTNKLKTKINVAEKEIDNIKQGDKVIAEWHNKSIEGKIIEIDQAMNPVTNAFTAVAVFDNSKKLLRSGVTTDLTIINDSFANVISTLRKNIVKEQGKAFVFVEQNGVAKKKEIRIGRSIGIYSEITEGINENDHLIVEGQMFLEDNTKVKVIK